MAIRKRQKDKIGKLPAETVLEQDPLTSKDESQKFIREQSEKIRMEKLKNYIVFLYRNRSLPAYSENSHEGVH